MDMMRMMTPLLMSVEVYMTFYQADVANVVADSLISIIVGVVVVNKDDLRDLSALRRRDALSFVVPTATLFGSGPRRMKTPR